MKKYIVNISLIVALGAIIYYLWRWIVGIRTQQILSQMGQTDSVYQDAPSIVAPVVPLILRGCDAKGCGGYGDSRDGGSRKHKGLDFKVTPGETVYSPINGTITREIDVYGDGKWKGLYIKGAEFDVKIFYLQYDPSWIGRNVATGDAIAIADNIQRKYGSSITPHIHLETWVLGSAVDPMPFFEKLIR